MELDTKFREAIKAVESETLEVNLAKMTYKYKLKKGEEMMLHSSQSQPARLLQKRPKSSRRQRVMKPLQLRLLQQRLYSTKLKRLEMRQRNKWTCSVSRFSNSMEISSLMRLTNPERGL